MVTSPANFRVADRSSVELEAEGGKKGRAGGMPHLHSPYEAC